MSVGAFSSGAGRRPVLGALLVATAVIGCPWSSPGSAEAAWDPFCGAYEVAYSSDRDDPNPLPPLDFPISAEKNFEIYTLAGSGSSPVRRTEALGNDQFLSWSPDGRQIAFESSRPSEHGAFLDYDIYAMRADGTKVRRLTSSPAVTRSPSGRRTASGSRSQAPATVTSRST